MKDGILWFRNCRALVVASGCEGFAHNLTQLGQCAGAQKSKRAGQAQQDGMEEMVRATAEGGSCGKASV